MPKIAKDNNASQTLKHTSKIFTDREEYRTLFWDTYLNFKKNIDKNIKNDITIITYYGVGGIGKTSLLDKLKDEINEFNSMTIPSKEDILYVHYDLKYDFNKRTVMEHIRKVLIDRYQFSFPIFDTANTIYRLKSGGENITSDTINSYFERHKIANSIIDLIGSIPAVGSMPVAVLKVMDTIISETRKRNSSRNIELSELQQDKPEDILNKLQVNFTKDIHGNLEDIKPHRKSYGWE